jgi:predicted secreted Zn-dependent protease
VTYTIVLPGWKAPAGVSTSTIRWWNGHVREIARHEKVHVDLYRAAAKKLNNVLGSSTCANVESRLGKVWNAVRREKCEFDMREYGYAAGLSMSECLAG